jgi:hypothetical protein
VAATAICLGVAAEGVLGLGPRVHWVPFGASEMQGEKPLFKW